MKKSFKMVALALGAMTTGILGSCTAESGYLNEPTTPGDPIVNLVKSTDVNAFANGFRLLSRAESDVPNAINNGEDYNYNFPKEIEAIYEIDIPSGAEEFKDDWNWINSHQDLSDPIYIPAGETRTFQVPNHFKGSLYIAGTYSPQTLGNNSDEMTIYILDGGELTYDYVSISQNGVIYNAGTLNMPKAFDGQKIKTIYNIGNIYIGEDVTWEYEFHSNCAIYSDGGYIEFNGSPKINGTIVSNNIVKSNGKIKFQSNGYRDICHLISTDLIEITDGSQVENTFGWIEGTNIKFDGCKVRLHPQGLVDMTNEVNIPNSNCVIRPYDSNSTGLVKCNVFSINMMNMPIHQALQEGIYLNTNSFYLQSIGSTYTNFNEIVSALSNSYSEGRGNGNISNDSVDDLVAFAKRVNTEIEVTPSCGESAGNDVPPVVVPEEPLVPLPGVDPEIPDIEIPDPLDPGFGIPTETPEHVEVNLEVEEHDDYLATHLSIHIRAVTDVEVVIPIARDYYVEADDMAIVQKHDPDLMVHGGPTEKTYDIEIAEGHVVSVTLTVSFEEDGIHVKTEGITGELIEYLNKTYGDGLTFEVWNYYNQETINNEISGSSLDDARNKLRSMLEENHATVEFTNEPPLYVNAFFYNDDYDADGNWKTGEDINPWDCTVDIVDSQAPDYNAPETDWWYNNAPYNELHKKK